MALKLVKNCKEFLENSDIVYRFLAVFFSFSYSSQKLIISSWLEFRNLEAIRKTAKKAGNVMSLLSVTYG